MSRLAWLRSCRRSRDRLRARLTAALGSHRRWDVQAWEREACADVVWSTRSFAALDSTIRYERVTSEPR